MNCALGISQLERIGSFLEKRRAVATSYHRRLRDRSELVLPLLSVPGRTISWFIYVVRLNANFDVKRRDAIRKFLNDAGIGCGRYFAPIHLQPAYRSFASGRIRLPVTESEADRTLALPFFNRISPGQIEEVCDCLLRALRRA
jgi:perosamine synthetase